VNIDNASDWWLGDINGQWFKALEDSIQQEWGVVPLRIREGGVRPMLRCFALDFSLTYL